MSRRVVLAGVVLTLALTACAKVSAGAPSDRPPAEGTNAPVRPLSVGLDQSGNTLQVHIGQELVVHLGPRFSVPPSRAPSVHYPSDLLGFTRKGTASGTYVFQGLAKGTGRIWIVEPRCAPGPALSADAPPAFCPVVGPASSDEGAGSWVFTATIRVVPLGL
jgi:hypothetical protein